MPSSLIFAGLVVLWLLILVPAVARRRQEVERPSVAALSGRVLERPVRHWSLEVDPMDTDDERAEPATGAVTTRGPGVPAARTPAEPEHAVDPGREDRGPGDLDRDDAGRDDPDPRIRDEAAAPDEGYAAAGYYAYDEDDLPAAAPRHEPRIRADEGWERPPASFRRGRGGFDAEAAALAARARYTFRQRVVVGLLVLAVVTALVAVLAVPALWWAHGLVDLTLVGYLVYLRRQVRMEEAIRERRAARMAGTRRSGAADDPELDEWARRGREVATREAEDRESADDEDEDAPDEAADEHAEDWTADDGRPERIRGTGEPVGVLPAHRRTLDGAAPAAVESALPRLQPAPPPPLPAGTQLVDVDDEDEDLPVAGAEPAGTYPRAAGQ
ncbi:divisome protein SepX/GlpR [Pseudonocardia xishanensis]|uniref:Uncharacterized protein n=1 Tax=Pseudonocardia xishanensis TaxID=630995 RepID=A0ABP8S5U8_9PSEU